MQVTTCRGEFADSEIAGALALQMYRRSDYAFVPPLIYPAFAAVRALRGDVDGAAEALDDWTATGARGLAPYRLLIVAATQDRDRLAGAAAFRPMGARPVDLFSLPILCAQAEVAAVLEDLSLLQDALGPLRALHQAGVRWCLGWPLLLARLIATAERLLGRADEAERWCHVAATEAARSGSAAEAARVSLERARLTDAGGERDTARAMALEAARAFDRLGMLPLHQEALRLVGDRATHERRGAHGPVHRPGRLNRHQRSPRRRRLRRTARPAQRDLASPPPPVRWCRDQAHRRWPQLVVHVGNGGVRMRSRHRDDLAEHNEAHPEGQLHVRFGLASGAPIPPRG